jgi:amino acid adenylation domain-containing protein
VAQPPVDSPPEKAAYILFTSGSQGTPKGVIVSHSALAHSTFVREEVYGVPPDCFLLLSSFAFDSSIAGLYWTICNGGHLVIAPRRAERDPRALGALIGRRRVSHALCLPGLYDVLLEAVDPGEFRCMRTVIVAGEAIRTDMVRKHRATMPECRLFNEYGPTEATVWATVFDATNWVGADTVPIGSAIPGVDAQVRDVDGIPLPDGVLGELVISGPTLADGYLNDPEGTARKFPLLPNSRRKAQRFFRTGDFCAVGCHGLLFAGRIDDQVKIRGHRVELGEIETLARATLPSSRCCALVIPQNGSNRLVLCVEADGSSVAETQLQESFWARNVAALDDNRRTGGRHYLGPRAVQQRRTLHTDRILRRRSDCTRSGPEAAGYG